MKRIFALLAALLALAALQSTVFATAEAPYLSDGASLLSEEEKASLEARLEEISSTYSAQVAIVTREVSELPIDTAVEAIYDNGAYGFGADFDGVLLLICMDTREYRILSNGFAADAITPSDIDSISDAIVPDLSAGDYAAAMETFAEESAAYLNIYVNGAPYDPVGILMIAAPIGLVAGLIWVLILKGQLKSVRRQNEANRYVRAGGLTLTRSGDYYMYRNVTRTPRPKESSSSHSSSSSRNVGGGRF